MKIPLLPKLLLKLAIITFLINVFLLTQACYYLFKSNILKQKLGNLNPYYHLLTREEYSQKLDLLSVEYSKILEDNHNPDRFLIYNDHKLIGFLYDIKEEMNCGVCSELRYLLYTDTCKNIKNILFLSSIEFYGKERETFEIAAFTSQFIDKDWRKLHFSDFDMLTGATKSSMLLIESIKQTLNKN